MAIKLPSLVHAYNATGHSQHRMYHPEHTTTESSSHEHQLRGFEWQLPALTGITGCLAVPASDVEMHDEAESNAYESLPSSQQDPDFERYGNNLRRKTVARACTFCKSVHLACDHARPCQQCVRRGIEDSCVDAVQKKRGRRPLGNNVQRRDLQRVALLKRKLLRLAKLARVVSGTGADLQEAEEESSGKAMSTKDAGMRRSLQYIARTLTEVGALKPQAFAALGATTSATNAAPHSRGRIGGLTGAAHCITNDPVVREALTTMHVPYLSNVIAHLCKLEDGAEVSPEIPSLINESASILRSIDPHSQNDADMDLEQVKEHQVGQHDQRSLPLSSTQTLSNKKVASGSSKSTAADSSEMQATSTQSEPGTTRAAEFNIDPPSLMMQSPAVQSVSLSNSLYNEHRMWIENMADLAGFDNLPDDAMEAVFVLANMMPTPRISLPR
eukprot:jgi/Hompol1/2134/HPOL_005860-RA